MVAGQMNRDDYEGLHGKFSPWSRDCIYGEPYGAHLSQALIIIVPFALLSPHDLGYTQFDARQTITLNWIEYKKNL